MIARASSFVSTAIRCSYQPIASASSWSEVITRANARAVCKALTAALVRGEAGTTVTR